MAWTGTELGEPPIDTVVRLKTPERIVFEYPLAGVFLRFWAHLIDWLVWLMIVVVSFFVLLFALGIQGIGPWLVLVFVMQWAFGAFCEGLFNGKTLGKVALRLRVVSAHGGPITWTQAIIRNLVSPVDGWPLGFMPGLIAMGLTEKGQRLGDLAASTIVVIERRPRPAPLKELKDPRIPKVLERLPAKLEIINKDMMKVISDYVERREGLHPERRAEMTKPLAKLIVQHYGLPTGVDPDILICSVYARQILGA